MPNPSQLTADEERALYEAGYLLLTKRKFPAAREVFEGLIAMTPGKGLPFTFLGNTYFAESKFEEAVQAHRKAVEIDSGNALSLAHLGEALIAVKEKQEAVQTLKKAQSLDPNGTAGSLAKSLLDAIDAKAL